MERSVALVCGLLVLSTLAGVAAAQETRTGGTVVVAEGETVEGLTAAAGTVVVRGTVDGNLQALAGDVYVAGEVTGDVVALSGNVRVDGRVRGDVSALGGNVNVGRSAAVGGSLEAVAGTVVVDGVVAGDARLVGGTVSLGPNAVLEGDLEYEGRLARAEGAAVGGSVVRRPGMRVGPVGFVPRAAMFVYGLLANALLGALLLLAFPTFSADVAARATADPLRTAGVGLVVAVGVPLALVLLAVTLVGIPLSIGGALVFGVVAWTAAVYGRFAVGTWVLSFTELESRWLALALGLVVVAAVARLPLVGGLVRLAVFLVGLGALALALRATVREREPAAPGEPVGGTGATSGDTVAADER